MSGVPPPTSTGSPRQLGFPAVVFAPGIALKLGVTGSSRQAPQESRRARAAQVGGKVPGVPR